MRLTPPIRMTLEKALAYIEDDELVEVTPKSIRLRKKLLDPNDRKRDERSKETEARHLIARRLISPALQKFLDDRPPGRDRLARLDHVVSVRADGRQQMVLGPAAGHPVRFDQPL